MKYQHIVKHFRELTTIELYKILQLRAEVFVVDQDCPYQDMDNKDFYCHHLCIFDNQELVAYARLLPAGLSYDEVSIGRVVTRKDVRGAGLGKKLMQLAIEECYRIFGKQNIQIGAQLYVRKFYGDLGFVEVGDIYDDVGIEHIHMIKYVTATSA